MKIDASPYSALYATAAVNWQGDYGMGEAGNVRFKPSAGVGVRQNLTGNEMDSELAFVGQNFKTQTTEDETSIIANAGIEWTKGRSSFGLIYDGAYGDDQTSHVGRLMFKYDF